MKTFLLLLLAIVCPALLPCPLLAAEKPEVIDLWPGKPPGEVGQIEAEKELENKPGETRVRRLTNITRPTLTIFRPSKEKDTGASVVICPGGGYYILAWDLEGEEVAQWLNSLGVTGILLKYRVPRRPGTANDAAPPQALMDVQRAVSLVRNRARDWKLDPDRIGLLGFSAGGHLTGWASTNYNKRQYQAIDAVDEVSCRPDFSILIYPWNLITKEKTALTKEIPVDSRTPPMFFAHAGDDPVPVENSILLYLGLRKAGVAADLHLYSSGGHGFGLRPSDHPCSNWPKRCEEWLRDRKILRSGS